MPDPRAVPEDEVRERVMTRAEVEAAHQDLQWQVGDTIRAIRRQEGLSIAELARRVGVAKGFLSRVEAGTRNVSVAYLAAVFESLGYRMKIEFFPAECTGTQYLDTEGRGSDAPES